MPLADLLLDANTRAESMVTRCRHFAGGQKSFSMNPYSAPWQNFNSAWKNANQARVQLDYFADYVYTSIRPIAQRIAGQEIKLGRQRRKNRVGARGASQVSRSKAPNPHKMPRFLRKQAEEMELIEQHPILDLLDDPNDLFTLWSMIYMLICNLELTGWGFWLMTDGDDGRTKLWPIPSHWVSRDPDFQSDNFNDRWLVRPGGAGAGEHVPGENLFAPFYPDPTNPLSAYGPLQSQARAVETDRSIQTSQSNTFKNGILPQYAVIAGDVTDGMGGRPVLEAEQQMQIINEIKRRYGGLVNAGEPIILDAIISDIKRLSNVPNEMDWLNSGSMTKERIMQGFGTNPIIAGQVESNSRAASAEADKHFCKSTVNPKIELLSQALTEWVGSRFEGDQEKLSIWIEPAVPDDGDEVRENIKTLSAMGAIGTKEARALLGLPHDIPKGDTVNVPFNLVPQDLLGQDSRFSDVLNADTEEDGKPKPADNQDDGDHTGKGLRWTRDGRVSLKSYKAFWLKMHSKSENGVRKSVAKFFKNQGSRIVSSLKSKFGDKSLADLSASEVVDAVYDSDAWRKKLRTAAKSPLMAAAIRGAVTELAVADRGKQYKSKSPIAFKSDEFSIPQSIMDAINAELDDMLDDWLMDLINEETGSRLKSTIAAAIENGDSLNELTDSIKELFGNMSRWRAETIARTETTAAVNAGHYSARKELLDEGLVTGSEWLTMGDELVRPSHEDADGQVIGAGQDFQVGDEMAPYPGYFGLTARERVNCRCTTVASGTFADDEEDDEPGDM